MSGLDPCDTPLFLLTVAPASLSFSPHDYYYYYYSLCLLVADAAGLQMCCGWTICSGTIEMRPPKKQKTKQNKTKKQFSKFSKCHEIRGFAWFVVVQKK